MVYRIYVEKKNGLDNDAKALLSDINNLLQIKSISSVRVINRYDVENIDKELFDYCKNTVLSEPQLDNTYDNLESDECFTFLYVG